MRRVSADVWFSRFIRLTYADEKGYCVCYTCGKRYFWKDIQCGHYIKRQYKTTRFNENNCRPQCVHCNYALQGNDIVFRKKLVNEIGENKVLFLEASKRNVGRFKKIELDYITKTYKEKL